MKAGSLPRLSPLAESSPQLLKYVTESPNFFTHLSIQNTRIQTQKDKCHVFSLCGSSIYAYMSLLT